MIVYQVVMDDYEVSLTDSVWKNEKDAEERAIFVQKLLDIQQKVWNLYWKSHSSEVQDDTRETLEEMLSITHSILQGFALDSSIDGIHATVEKHKVR